MTIAAVVVTHNAARWLPALLDSIAGQSRQVDHLIVVDDRSSDETEVIARNFGAEIVPSSATAKTAIARTGQNFLQGVLIARRERYELVLLSDHDDVWRGDRVKHQSVVMESHPHAAMVASNGELMDANGSPVITDGDALATLRSAFPVPRAWQTADAPERFRIALRHSIATGGASMIRPARLDGALDVPAGWLHDRWWSLAATAMDAMIVDDRAVIGYRLSANQQVGLDRGNQGRSTAARLAAGAANAPNVVQRARDLRDNLIPVAAVDVKPELAWPRLLRSLA